MLRHLAWLALALTLGCRERTEVMIGVATDLRAKGQIDLVELSVERNGVQIIKAPPWDLSDVPAGRFELPGSFGLFTNDGSEPRFEVIVKGFKGNQLVVRRDATLSLVSGKTLFVRMGLVAGCDTLNAPSCAANEVCVEGVCRPKVIEKERMPAFDKNLVDHWACRSGTNWIFSGSGDPMPKLDDGMCNADELCSEATCFKLLKGEDGALQQGLWVQETNASTFVLHGLWGTADGQDVFAVGEAGTILRHSGGNPFAGAGWLPEESPTTQALWSVWGTSVDDVYAVGAGGTILHRTATGWAAETAPAGVLKLESVYGVGGSVWAVGRGPDGEGVILRRGATGMWVAQARPSAPLVALWASAVDDLWAVGPKGNVMRGNVDMWRDFDAGAMSTPLYGVGGTARNDVYMVGRGGLILKWDGAQVVPIESPTKVDLFAVWAAGPGEIYIAGDHGVILHSLPNGSFELQPSGTRQPLFTLWASGPNNIYSAGRDGIVLHSGGTGVVLDMSMPATDDASTSDDMSPPPDLTPVAYVNAYHHMPDAGFWVDVDPGYLEVAPGTTVIWRWGNADGGVNDTHSITSCTPGATGCDQKVADGAFCHSYSGPSPSPGPAACMPVAPSPGPYSYQHRFDTPGTYNYFCAQHGSFYGTPTITGKIVVK